MNLCAHVWVKGQRHSKTHYASVIPIPFFLFFKSQEPDLKMRVKNSNSKHTATGRNVVLRADALFGGRGRGAQRGVRVTELLVVFQQYRLILPSSQSPTGSISTTLRWLDGLEAACSSQEINTSQSEWIEKVITVFVWQEDNRNLYLNTLWDEQPRLPNSQRILLARKRLTMFPHVSFFFFFKVMNLRVR